MADEFQVEVPQTALARSLELMEAWRAMPKDGYVDVRVGRSDDGTVAAVCLTIDGQNYGLTAAEARTLADITASTIAKFPEQSAEEGLPTLMTALIEGANKAEAQ